MAERRIGRGEYSEIDDEGGTLLPHPIGTTMSLADYQQLQNNYVGSPELYHETRGMTPEQFLRSPYSQYQLQPDGTVRFRGMGEGWQNPTWIDQDPNSIGAGLKQALPYLAAFTGAGAALGGLSGLGIPGLFGEAASSSFLPGTMDAVPGAFGSGAGSSLSQVLSGAPEWAGGTIADAALGGETYLPFSMDPAGVGLGNMSNVGQLDLLQPALGNSARSAASLMANFDPNADYNEYLSGNYGTPAAVAPGVSQATGNLWPALSAAGTGASLLKGNSNAEQTAGLLKQLGLDISPAALGMLGTSLSTALGAYGANQQANALTGIANQARADRQPFLNDALDMLQNPNKFYERPEVTGAIDASLRGLSAKVGNPINNPGALAQQAAYNLGMYNNALTSRANLGLSGQDTTSRLQTNAALANNGLYNALGSGLGSMLSTTPNMNLVLADYLSRQL